MTLKKFSKVELAIFRCLLFSQLIDGLFIRITTLNSIEGHENSVDYYYDYIDDEKQNSGVLKRHSITKKLQLNVSKTVSPITLLIIFTLVLNIFFSNFYYPK